MNIALKQLIVFDLDGTLSKSKMPMDEEMAALFVKLLYDKHIAVISGGGWKQFELQFLKSLPAGNESFTNLILLPTSGTRMYTWRGGWCEQYAEHLSPKEKERVMIAFNEALKAGGYVKPEKTFGDIIEDRGSQMTFSALGQNAPIELKSAWDPDREKRERIAAILREKIPEYDVRIGGTTSIDVTHRGVNKAYGIHKLEDHLKIPIENMLFVGDALFHGGNDYPAKATGIDCIEVSGPEETKKLIGSWLA